jgi:hypothetical protein
MGIQTSGRKRPFQAIPGVTCTHLMLSDLDTQHGQGHPAWKEVRVADCQERCFRVDWAGDRPDEGLS